ncbi:hypothetical protein ACHAW5_004464 [Stephanodiscus triporus]|uniref:Integrase zinc-binding domain-containing protein n=1 Tax=Stephanodiscus triporus TaxID=2934178 RepID=A0ABD3QHK0_9STRA
MLHLQAGGRERDRRRRRQRQRDRRAESALVGGDDGPSPPSPALTNEILVPDRRASDHGDEFYLRLTNGEANASTISSWRPPPNNANWKSRVDEWMDVVRHWDTGKDGLDAGAFRARHKTFYSRIKPASCNLGRRTGMHLREAMVDAEVGEGGGRSRPPYNKAGNKSIMYLAVDQLFGPLFQLHSLELSHRGRDATKTLADERYANVPDATIRAFLDTCPICAARRGHHVIRNGPDVVADPSKQGGGHHDQSSIMGLQDSI